MSADRVPRSCKSPRLQEEPEELQSSTLERRGLKWQPVVQRGGGTLLLLGSIQGHEWVAGLEQAQRGGSS